MKYFSELRRYRNEHFGQYEQKKNSRMTKIILTIHLELNSVEESRKKREKRKKLKYKMYLRMEWHV